MYLNKTGILGPRYKGIIVIVSCYDIVRLARDEREVGKAQEALLSYHLHPFKFTDLQLRKLCICDTLDSATNASDVTCGAPMHAKCFHLLQFHASQLEAWDFKLRCQISPSELSPYASIIYISSDINLYLSWAMVTHKIVICVWVWVTEQSVALCSCKGSIQMSGTSLKDVSG